jgi:hypothetical protein
MFKGVKMIFKKKYKRSAWMEGLLEAEALYKDDWSTDGIRAEFFRPTSDEKAEGACCYCWFIDNLKARENK